LAGRSGCGRPARTLQDEESRAACSRRAPAHPEGGLLMDPLPLDALARDEIEHILARLHEHAEAPGVSGSDRVKSRVIALRIEKRTGIRPDDDPTPPAAAAAA